jgi:alcohol dehydrogenase (cytochrome c)
MPKKEPGWYARSGGAYKAEERYESTLTAVDPVTGEVRQNLHLPYPNYSGTLSTGGGLVFVGLLDGTVAAYDDTTLAELWKINVGSGFVAPPMTYSVNGKQYIALTLGGRLGRDEGSFPEAAALGQNVILVVFGL